MPRISFARRKNGSRCASLIFALFAVRPLCYGRSSLGAVHKLFRFKIDDFLRKLIHDDFVKLNFDLKFFIKHLKEFYRSKGSEKSFRTLFRLIWGQEHLWGALG